MVNSETYAGTGTEFAYGILKFDWVTRINEMYANQSIISPPKGFLEVHGGNVAVTIHGFLRDNDGMNRKQQKSYIEIMRNLQAMFAHIPMRILDIVDPMGLGSKLNPLARVVEMIFGDTGIGQLALWTFTILPFIGWLSCEMTFHTNMVIKSMEFEHSSEFADEYAYTISFEKISLGLVQYAIDLISSIASGIMVTPRNRVSNIATNSPKYGSGHDYTTSNKLFTGVNDILVNIQQLADPQFVTELADSLAPFDVAGQLAVVTTTSDDGYTSNPNDYRITPRIDDSLEWKRIPFQNALPHSFVFTLNDNNYKMVLKAMVTINDEDSPSYYLHLTLTKNDDVLYIGKIIEGVQFTFGGDLNIVLNTFKLYLDDDKSINVTIEGIMASG